MKLPISEKFTSIQGEGKTMGVPSIFVRLGGCNLLCGGHGTIEDGGLHNGATWRCDTIEVWMKHIKQEIEDVLSMDDMHYLMEGAHLIITGGEPLLHQDALCAFIQHIDKTFMSYIEIETNGTIEPNGYLKFRINQWNCSPKLSNSGNRKSVRIKEEVIEEFNRLNTCFKFVITTRDDYDEMERDFAPYIDSTKVWLMPSGEDQSLLNESRKTVAQLCVDQCYNYSARLHINIWNQKTGV